LDRRSLREAVTLLNNTKHSREGHSTVYVQAVSQFSALLEIAKSLYPKRADIQAIQSYSITLSIDVSVFSDAVFRLKSALEMDSTESTSDLFAQIQLPSDAPVDIGVDMLELAGAISLGLSKAALLLSGSIAESLLVSRHPDKSERGPGLNKLVEQARRERLFGKDTLNGLGYLVDYRDLIHPRAEIRNKTIRNEARVETALTALKLLCSELGDPNVRYDE